MEVTSQRWIRPVAEAAIYTTHNKHKGQTYTLPAEFEPAIPEIKRLQTYALDLYRLISVADVQFHSFFNSALHLGEYLHARQLRFGEEKNLLSLLGFESRIP
jgi:hypothetical protein